MEIDLGSLIAIGTAVIAAASTFCALTPTPDPQTVWGKVYRIVEFLALIIGKAKESGILPPNGNGH